MEYKIDNAKSNILWKAYQPKNYITGKVSFKQGKIVLSKGLITGGFAQVDFATIKVTDTKLTSDQQNTLEKHLKSGDFFNLLDHPSALFEVAEVRPSSGFTTHIVVGDLTIKGITHRFEIPTNIVIEKDKLDIKAKFTITRTRYNIDFMIEESFAEKKILPEFDIEIHIVGTAK
ncbi:MAG: YceI family protein [Bacteroidetes bacterium]|nr:YceI family protein [Bacteroidota bacterium]HET6245919.1 YceI family protein [Bacteroidia bacterium]